MHPFKSIINKLLSSSVNRSGDDTPRNETIHSKHTIPERATFTTDDKPRNETMHSEHAVPGRAALLTTIIRHQDHQHQLPDNDTVTFKATALRESYTLQDVEKGLRQVTMGEFHGMDETFVDFIMGGFIEDELELYRNKKCIKSFQQSA